MYCIECGWCKGFCRAFVVCVSAIRQGLGSDAVLVSSLKIRSPCPKWPSFLILTFALLCSSITAVWANMRNNVINDSTPCKIF